MSHVSLDPEDRPRSGLDESAVINAVDRDTGNKLDGSELCRPPSMLRELKLAPQNPLKPARKHPNLTVIVLADGDPDDDLLPASQLRLQSQ